MKTRLLLSIYAAGALLAMQGMVGCSSDSGGLSATGGAKGTVAGPVSADQRVWIKANGSTRKGFDNPFYTERASAKTATCQNRFAVGARSWSCRRRGPFRQVKVQMSFLGESSPTSHGPFSAPAQLLRLMLAFNPSRLASPKANRSIRRHSELMNSIRLGGGTT